MSKIHKPRAGSLQFWPRKRASKILPSVNWKPLEEKAKSKILGFIGYKVGMLSAVVKDNTPDSLTKNKKIILPVTIIECPSMKIYSVRFYKNSNVAVDVISNDVDKFLKRKLIVPKKQSTNIDEIGKNLDNYDDIRIIAYTLAKQTNIKKVPDIIEIGLKGTVEEKFGTAKNLINKEIKINDVFEKDGSMDIRGVTKGKGIEGPIKRFGISLKSHKTEKGVRRPGTLGPWRPRRVSFKAPLAGQFGFFSRVNFNNKIIDISRIAEKDINPKSGFKHYGIIKSDYVVVKGSVQGPAKRPLVLTSILRPKKEIEKQKFELIKME